MRRDPGEGPALQLSFLVEMDPVFREVRLFHLGHDVFPAQPSVVARERADRLELGRDQIAAHRFEIDPQESGRSSFGGGERQFLKAGAQHEGRRDQQSTVSAALLADQRNRPALVVDGGRSEALAGHECATDPVLPRKRNLELDRWGLNPQQQDLFAGQPRSDFRARLELRVGPVLQFLQQGFRLGRAGRQAERLPVQQPRRVGVERFVKLDHVAVQEHLPGAPGLSFLQALPGSLDGALCLAQVLRREGDHLQLLRLPGQRALDEFELGAQTLPRRRGHGDHQPEGRESRRLRKASNWYGSGVSGRRLSVVFIAAPVVTRLMRGLPENVTATSTGYQARLTR